jgi:hypothetical protein
MARKKPVIMKRRMLSVWEPVLFTHNISNTPEYIDRTDALPSIMYGSVFFDLKQQIVTSPSKGLSKNEMANVKKKPLIGDVILVSASKSKGVAESSVCGCAFFSISSEIAVCIM